MRPTATVPTTSPPGSTTSPPGWQIDRATTARARARGLLGRRELPPRRGLWLQARSVHTVGMRFALDLVWLADDGRVLRVDRDVVPGRLRSCWRARGGVIEVAAGSGPALVAALAVSWDPAAAR